MKIKQLVKKLSKLNQNLDVVLSSDEEGNSFRILNRVCPVLDKFNDEGFEPGEDYEENNDEKPIRSVILF